MSQRMVFDSHLIGERITLYSLAFTPPFLLAQVFFFPYTLPIEKRVLSSDEALSEAAKSANPGYATWRLPI